MPPKAQSAVEEIDALSGSSNPVASVLDEFADRTMRDIAEELSRLRLDNARLAVVEDQLQSRVHDMTLEVSLLQKERAAFKGAAQYLIEYTGYMPPAAPRQPTCGGKLPHEILLAILRATRAPRYQLNPSVTHCRGQKSAWLAELRFRKGLILVCRWWSGPATQLLYEDIVLRRMGQILALADVLAASLEAQTNLPQLVKSIRMDTCVVLAEYAQDTSEALRAILELCTALQVFEYHTAAMFPTVITPPAEGLSGAFNPAWFVDGSNLPFQVAFRERVAGLAVLDLAMPVSLMQVAHLHGLLSSTTRLHTLKMRRVDNTEAEEDHLGTLRTLHLPQLTELYIPINNERFVAYVSATWGLPRLARLTALDARSIPDVLLAAHGVRLRYLHLCPSKLKPFSAEVTTLDLARVVGFCPLLEHFAIPRGSNLSWAYIQPIPGPPLPECALRYVDMWWSRLRRPYPNFCPSEYSEVPEEGFELRYLSKELAPHSVDLPALCDPRVNLGGGDTGTRTIYLPGRRAEWARYSVIHDSGNIGADVPDDYYLSESEEESGSGTSDDEEDSSSSPDTEDEGHLSGEEGSGEAEALGEDAVDEEANEA